MGVMTIDSEIVLGMLNEIGSKRALTDRETDLIEEIVTAEGQPFKWNPRLDIGLQVAAHSVGGLRRFAKRHGISDGAVYKRLGRIRARQKREAARKQRKG